MNWTWWVLAGLPFPHLVRVMDCFFHEGIKVFYRISLAILILFQKHVPSTSTQITPADAASASSSSTTSKIDSKTKLGANWKSGDDKNNDIENVLPNFCRNIPVSPAKLLRTAFNIRALRYLFWLSRNQLCSQCALFNFSSTYISRVFIKTEMVLRSKTILSGSKGLVHSRSSDNLPTSQSQVNIQMISHTLSIREVSMRSQFID